MPLFYGTPLTAYTINMVFLVRWRSPWSRSSRAVEIVLKEGGLRDSSNFRPDAAMWNLAVRSCGYVQARQAVSTELLAATP